MKDSRFDKTREFNWHAAERDIYDDILLSSDARKKKKKHGRKPQRGAQQLKNIVYAFLFAALAVVSVIYMPIFNIDEIRVVGNSYISAEEACRMAGVYRGEHVFAVKTDEAQRRLLKDLRIDKASVRRLFPNGLIIEIEERRPVLTVACEYGYIDIDREGLVLAAYRQPAALPVPLLLDMKVHDLYIGDRVSEPPILAIAAFFGDIGSEVEGLQEVSIADPEHIVCYTPDRTELRVGRLEREKEKATICRDFLSEIKTARHPFEYIDLRFETPFVKLRQGEKQDAPIQYRPAHAHRESMKRETAADDGVPAGNNAAPPKTEAAKADSDGENNEAAAKKKSDGGKTNPPAGDAAPAAKGGTVINGGDAAQRGLQRENQPKEPSAPEGKKDADNRKA